MIEAEEGIQDEMESGADVAAEAAPAGRRRWPWLLLVLVLLAGGGAFAWYQFLGPKADAAAETADAEAGSAAANRPAGVDAGTAEYLALDPPLVVNFAAGGQLRYLQVSVDLMAASKKDLDQARRHEPALRHALIALFSERDYEALLTRAGKEALRQEALQTVQAELQKLAGRPLVADVYFSTFVMQ